MLVSLTDIGVSAMHNVPVNCKKADSRAESSASEYKLLLILPAGTANSKLKIHLQNIGPFIE